MMAPQTVLEAIGTALRPVRAGRNRSRLAALAPPLSLGLSSSAFRDGGAMPDRYGGRGVGENLSPPLRWTEVPANTAALALAIEDEDVPLPRPLMHTVAVLDPTLDHLDEGSLQPGAPGLRFFRTPLGYGYSGPRPIPGHGAHHYRFYLFAVPRPIPDDVTTRHDLFRLMRDSATARGVLSGTYERP
ncbi:YbhB/YbcL family Raf kinase inhibitor-like protein [Mycolicibacterium senegalense]|uniref:PeBP family protein n=2 Tax=Mycobacteriaceae TaxID=1762 RepID=A0A378W5Q3_9MYCO|nr:YbhB/YbcL family Raf kinase inhibitor-like protein [Mycolicibacterium senegalense]CDP86268.1 phosphatidylethanolamine-binding protein [Mycolicibacterium farcinogenes]SUA28443.1 peBP family protein [Mycolicibacterium senegalense]